MATTPAELRVSPYGQAAASNGGNLAVVGGEWQLPRRQTPALTQLALAMAPIALGVDWFLFTVVVAWPNRLASWIQRRRSQHVPRRRCRERRRPHAALCARPSVRASAESGDRVPHAQSSSPCAHGRQEVEVENIVRALRGYRVLTRPWLADVCRAAHWSDSGFRQALAQAVSTGKIKRLGNDLYGISEAPIR